MIQKYMNYYLKKHASPRLVLGIDLALSGLVYVLAYVIRFELTWRIDLYDLGLQVVFMMGLAWVAFIIFGTYKGVIRETTVKDASKISYAAVLQLLMGFSIALVLNRFFELDVLVIPTSILLINGLLLLVVLVVSRFLFKHVYNGLKTHTISHKHAFIYGAGDSGILTLQAIENDTTSPYKILGFLDDDARKAKKKINGLPIYHSSCVTTAFLEAHEVKTVILSIQNISNRDLLAITDQLLELKLKVNTVPPANTWLEGALQPHQIKPLEIEDLLNRATIELDNPKLARFMQHKTVLITGAAGSIGSELVRQLCKYPYKKLVLVDQAESALYNLEQDLLRLGQHAIYPCVEDVCDAASMELVFETHLPDMVIHAAAYKHVPLMEQQPYQAIKTNIMGTKILADLALDYDCKSFLMVSTDKAVNPTNIMGATKRAAEVYLTALSQQQASMKITITRFGNVLGSNGSVIPLFKKQLEQGGPLTLTHQNITRYFMTITEACNLILEAGTMGKGGDIYVFDMGAPVRIFDLAKRMIELSGLRYPEDISIAITGLRPGEKLYEELLASKEQTLKTHHPKILIAQTRTSHPATQIAQVEAILKVNTPILVHKAVQRLKTLLPEYLSQNSEWERYDGPPNLLKKA